MEHFSFWQDALDNMYAERQARLERLACKYGENFERDDLSFADQIEYDMAVGAKNAELEEFCSE